jgi:hypothetical protein
MTKVSFSQYSLWSQCPRQYKLAYIDGLATETGSIHLIFGSAMHTVLQNFLTVMYGVTKAKAMNMDLNSILKIELMNEFNKQKKDMPPHQYPCTQAELNEFFEDGKQILHYFKTKLGGFFSKSGYELVAVELPLSVEIKPGIHFQGFLDVVLREVATRDITITDFKTSTRGWSKYQKTDAVKNSQLLLYKKFYAEKFKISEDKINVEFHILKRKVIQNENMAYTIPRISRHVPASGTLSIKKAWNNFMIFVESVYDDEGKFKLDSEYPKKPSKLCEWCEFYHKYCDGKV